MKTDLKDVAFNGMEMDEFQPYEVLRKDDMSWQPQDYESAA